MCLYSGLAAVCNQIITFLPNSAGSILDCDSKDLSHHSTDALCEHKTRSALEHRSGSTSKYKVSDSEQRHPGRGHQRRRAPDRLGWLQAIRPPQQPTNSAVGEHRCEPPKDNYSAQLTEASQPDEQTSETKCNTAPQGTTAQG